MSRWICLSCLFLLLPLVVFAQAQAPITWGSMRLLANATDSVTILMDRCWAEGDTIVLQGARYGTGSGEWGMVKISGDNGLSWTPWHIFRQTNSFASSVWPFIFGPALCICAAASQGWGIHRTTDLGQTWLAPYPGVSIRLPVVCQDTLYGQNYSDSVTWSADGGQHFSARRNAGFLWFEQLAISPRYIHVLAPDYWNHHLTYARGPHIAGPFETLRVINPEILIGYNARMEFDDNGIGMIASVNMYDYPAPDWGAILINTTHDDGTTWSPPDTVTPFETANPLRSPLIRHCNSLWAVAWDDSTRILPPVEDYGTWVRFSANWGRSWYPIRQVLVNPYGGGGLSALDVRSSYIRIYANNMSRDGSTGPYYSQWEGQIHPDTLAPVMTDAVQLDTVIRSDSSVTFFCQASDNDSLWQMTVILWPQSGGDSLRLPMVRSDSSHYEARWQVPQTTADWNYYYRAEDMWERVSFAPANGPVAPWTFRVTISSVHQTPSPLTQQIAISIYPNPSNGSVTITGVISPNKLINELVVYDILGREVSRLPIPRGSTGDFSLNWNMEAALQGPISTGVYFIVPASSAALSPTRLTIVR